MADPLWLAVLFAAFFIADMIALVLVVRFINSKE